MVGVLSYRVASGVVLQAVHFSPYEYDLHVSEVSQRPFDLFMNKFRLSVNALEIGLRFPLYPLVVSCLQHRRVSPSQIMQNSWCYIIVFIGECRVTGIVLTLTLFLACFCLSKGQGSYYLISRSGFCVCGAPSNNVGWKSRFFINAFQGWDFGLKWTRRDIDNSPSLLIKEKAEQVVRLRGIFSSKAIKSMKEAWLVEAGLSPDPAGTTRSSQPPSNPAVEVSVTHGADHTEMGPMVGATRGVEPPTNKTKVLVVSQPRSMRDLYRFRARYQNEPFLAREMEDLQKMSRDGPLEARWAMLTLKSKVWADGADAQLFYWGSSAPLL
ncbi:hypothetical protein B296_00000984 [Ensete ventricosum]|uniref:Transposase (putative) gypsy type domain-containing protein n=1 Tax=Ensete ventricosum TaxID=4639 RepID=A0A427B1Z7_ENSVE|nr:hypothetical protein B296_00000984 [Ensete ventricosum]